MKIIYPLILAMIMSFEAHCMLITPETALEINFNMRFSAPPTTDMLSLAFYRTTNFGSGFLTAKLYDGSEFLGSYTLSSTGTNQFFFFKDGSSLFNFYNPTEIDFSSILDRSINGTLRISVASGSRDIDPFDSALNFGEGVANNSYKTGGSFNILDARLVDVTTVPEPSSLMLLLGGLSLVLVRSKYLKSNKRVN